MADNKKNNENKKNNNNVKGEKKMAKATKITVSMANGQIMITKIDGKAVDEPRRFGVYNCVENMLPRISIRPKVGGWLNLDAYVAEDENGKLTVAVNHEPDAYWNLAEVILGGKKNVNSAKKTLIAARKNAIEKKQQAEQTAKDNGMVIGATKTGYIYSKQLPGIQEEVIDLGEKFGKRTMRWGKGLDCTKIYNSDKEVARIMWDKDGASPRIRLMGEEDTRYYMLSYDQKSFIYFEDKKKVVVMDGKLATALMFFYRNFVMKLAELKGWKLPDKKQPYYQDKGYWNALEKEYEEQEAAIEAARMAKKNNKA